MPINIGDQPQPDFDHPIELMMNCHRRIERFLQVLQDVIAAKAGGPLDQEHAKALRTALDYFQSGAPRHTADEEQSLFPRMRQLDDQHVQQVLAAMDKLEADHHEAEQVHQRVDELGRRWLEENQLASDAFNELRKLVDKLQQTYQEHIAMEDQQIFPLANQVLADSQQTRIGQEMRARRAELPGRDKSRCAQRRKHTLNDDSK